LSPADITEIAFPIVRKGVEILVPLLESFPFLAT
tara:strand:+ start:435 stop:536 length:102 start_codon:yes stop_codon:yes gene_type:complete